MTARPPPLLLRARQSASVAIRARGSPSFAGRAGHLGGVRAQHEADFAVGGGRVYLPDALARKLPAADREWGWQWVFPSGKLSVDSRTGIERRHQQKVDAAEAWLGV